MRCRRCRLSLAAWIVPALLLSVGLGLIGAAGAQARAPLTQCEDGIDNDLDGKIDAPFDPGCATAGNTDNSEINPTPLPQCSDGLANTDGDGKTDFPADPQCLSAGDTSEAGSSVTQCANNVDDDNPDDGVRDWPTDPKCLWAADPNEVTRACSNGVDDDGDGAADFPADPGCSNHDDNDERDLPQCNDGRDNDHDGNVDAEQDPDCLGSPSGVSEGQPATPPPACADGLDNDSDGLIDLLDQGCSSALDDDETNTQVFYVLPPLGPSSNRTRLLTPFPIVRLRGRVDGQGVRVTLLTVRAPAKSTIAIYCSGRSCPRKRLTVKVGRKLVRASQFERRLRGGTELKVYVTKTGFVGKYTRFRFLDTRVPLRTDRCVTKAGTKPRPCPAS